MKYAINAPAAPESIGPYSQGTTAGRLVFASGQLPIAPEHPHHIVPGGIREQTEQVLSDVAQTNVYLTDIRDLQAFNEVYARYFTPPAPARSVVAVSALPMGALVEMDCVACR